MTSGPPTLAALNPHRDRLATWCPASGETLIPEELIPIVSFLAFDLAFCLH
jgi:hypothetical protein